MFLRIHGFLTAAEIKLISEGAKQAKFVDGRLTNPHTTVKNNAICDDKVAQEAAQITLGALDRSAEVSDFAFPQRVAFPILCRYSPGMEYGPHVDAAYMSANPYPMRSDISCSVFITGPSEYEGGELVAHLGTEMMRVKGEAGSAIFYPSTTVHQVTPVTSGERLVMVTFIESQIREEIRRDLLFSLSEVYALEGLKMDLRNRTQFEYVIANLSRMWGS